MPLSRRLPKRGFNNARFATRHLIVNVETLNRFEDGTRVDEAALRKAGIVKRHGDGIKVLGSGELTRKLVVCAQAFSASARAKIEKAGGTCETAGATGAA